MDRPLVTLEEIYEEFFPKIYNYFFYRLLHKEETEDLVSQVFVKIAEHLDRYDPHKARLSTWIYRIAENTLTDYFRTRKAPLSYDHEENGLESKLTVEFEEQYEKIASPKRRAVFSALAQMGERDRTIVYYAYFRGMSYREIAKKMQMGESTLASALMRAKQKLKTHLEQSGDLSMLREK